MLFLRVSMVGSNEILWVKTQFINFSIQRSKSVTTLRSNVASERSKFDWTRVTYIQRKYM